MRLLDALVRSSTARGREATRYSFDEWLSDAYNSFTFGGRQYPLAGQNLFGGWVTTYDNQKAEPVSANFGGYVSQILQSNGVVSAVELVRLSVFSEARFQFQRLRSGRPGDLFGTQDLTILERPWPGGTTGDLLARMILDADLAGNWYGTIVDGEVVRLRPDWVEIVLEPRAVDQAGQAFTVGMRRKGYLYYEGGKEPGKEPAVFLADEVAHFAPYPDPLTSYRGMSWLTPVVREVQADGQATKHKLKFFENAATPNLAVGLPKEITPEQFRAFVDLMDAKHKGTDNAYKTLYTGGGADVTVIGADMKQLDFKTTQGAGETRIAAAAGVHPVIVGLSEGMAGSSLNAGNFGAARRRFADGTMRPLWRNAAGSLEVLVPPPPPGDSRLWYDDRDIGFLREDARDAAEIQQTKAISVRQLLDAGYHPDAVIQAVNNDDFSILSGQHSGLFSVQLQPPGESAAQPQSGGQQTNQTVG